MDCSRPSTRIPDEWVEQCGDFSRPVCAELRELIFDWEPDLSEAVKWNMLCFSGRKLVVGMSGCKRHVGLAFFRGVELADPSRLFTENLESQQMRSIRITDIAVLDRVALRELLRAAVLLDASEAPPPPTRKREPLPVPDFVANALKHDAKAGAGFAKLSPSCQREYIVWLASAKRPETRERRLAETLTALRSGRKWMDRKG